MPDPNAERRRCEPSWCDERSSFVSRSPPRLAFSREGYPRLGGLSFRRSWRVKQNLSFVSSPSIIISGFGALMAPGKGYTLPCASDYESASREILSRVRA